MTSHQISLRDEVYQRLQAIKKADESYSDVIDRLLEAKSNKESLFKLYGIAGEDELGFADIISSSRREIETSLKNRFSWD
ncbi:MAG: antitoxin VapB family protein [Promethearchaeota archaeon]